VTFAVVKDSWVLVLQRRGQAKLIISNSRPHNQIKDKGGSSTVPDPPPSPPRAERSSSPPQRRSPEPHRCQLGRCSRTQRSPSLLPGKGDAPARPTPPGWGRPAGVTSLLGLLWEHRGDARLPREHPQGTNGELPPAPGMLRWYPLQMFAHRVQGKNIWFPALSLSPTLQK